MMILKKSKLVKIVYRTQHDFVDFVTPSGVSKVNLYRESFEKGKLVVVVDKQVDLYSMIQESYVPTLAESVAAMTLGGQGLKPWPSLDVSDVPDDFISRSEFIKDINSRFAQFKLKLVEFSKTGTEVPKTGTEVPKVGV